MPEFMMSRLRIRRDDRGTLHVSGAPVSMLSCDIDNNNLDWPAFCVHHGREGDRCPGEAGPDERVFTLGNFVRGWASENDGSDLSNLVILPNYEDPVSLAHRAFGVPEAKKMPGEWQ